VTECCTLGLLLSQNGLNWVFDRTYAVRGWKVPDTYDEGQQRLGQVLKTPIPALEGTVPGAGHLNCVTPVFDR